MADISIPDNEVVLDKPTNAFVIPDNEVELDSDKYGTTGQQLKAGLEGVASGVAGPLAPLIETKVLGVKPEDIRARQEANPITRGVGEALGLIGGALTGTGEAAVMGKAGKLATEAAGFGNVLKAEELGQAAAQAAKVGLPEASQIAEQAKAAHDALSLGHKVGSAAVQQAAEMAVLSSGDEVAKRILQDPDTSAEGAIANIGLSAALGGVGGAAIAGVASPLWSATKGSKLGQLLGAMKSKIDGGSPLARPVEVDSALKTLGLDSTPIQNAIVSDSPAAKTAISNLRRAENEQVLNGIHDLKAKAADSVMNSLGTTTEDVLNFDKNEAGHRLHDTWTKEYDKTYGPVEALMQKRDELTAPIKIADETRLDAYGKLLERGVENVGTDSPHYDLYKQYADRLLAKDTAGDINKLKTEINDFAKPARFNDPGKYKALTDIRNMLTDVQEANTPPEIFEQLQKANKNYREFAQVSQELADHLGVGEFAGAGGLKNRLANKVTAENLLNKFSIRNNMDFAPFLAQHFPETYAQVLNNERRDLLKQSVIAAAKKDEFPIDINKLHDKISRTRADSAKYLETVMPEEALNKIDAAKTLMNSIPSPRDSGTPAGLWALMKHVPATAMGAIGALTGHSPLAGLVLGEAAAHIGKNAPEAMQLGFLKFLGSNEPIKSEGFKAMVDFMHNVYRGEHALNRGVSNLLKGGSQVLTASQMPSDHDRERLDRKIDDSIKNPEPLMQAQMKSDVGHYLPQHQVAASKVAMNALNYLQGIKPKPFKPGPLDKEIQPSKLEVARYNRALDIAQQPAVILQHIKNGTLQTTDIQDLNAMYPGLYKQVQNKISQQLAKSQANEEIVPYKTRMSMSLFLGQPLDMSMQPASIQAAQPKPKAPMPQQQQNPSKGRPSALKGKSAKMYQTPGQASESDRSSRD